MTDLKSLCIELHVQLSDGKEWNEELKKFVFSHPALFEASKRIVSRLKWIDETLETEVLARAAMAEGWLQLKKAPSREHCVGQLIVMLERWAFRVPVKPLANVVGGDALSQVPDHFLDVATRYDGELLRSKIKEWIRQYTLPKKLIAMNLIEAGLTVAQIARKLGKAEATISEHVTWIRNDLARKIRQWQGGEGQTHYD